MDLADQIVDSWRINNRINLYLLDAIPDAALLGISASKGRNVGQQFAHIHSVRLMWMKPAAPDLLDGIPKIDAKQPIAKEMLRSALEASGLAVEKLLSESVQTGKVKGFKPHVVGFLGYLLSHEGYHRGEIGIILTQSGHPLDDSVSYGLWEWGTR